MKKVIAIVFAVLAVLTSLVWGCVKLYGYYYVEEISTVVVLKDDLTGPNVCAYSKHNCVQTHHYLTFVERVTGKEFKFHGWTEADQLLELNDIKIGQELRTRKNRWGQWLAIYDQPMLKSPAYWAFMEYGGHIELRYPAWSD